MKGFLKNFMINNFIVVFVFLLIPVVVFGQNPFSSPFEEVDKGSSGIGVKPNKVEGGSIRDVDRVATWRLVGVMSDGNRKVAMLDLSDGRVIVVKEGEVIDRVFKVVKIGDGFVVVSSKGKQRKITFLGGNR